MKLRFLLVFFLGTLNCTLLRAVDSDIQQLVVSLAPGWNASSGKLQCFERSATGWKPATGVIPVLYGKNGLAWGRGVRGEGEAGVRKSERDGRAPAGVFRIGKIYTYDAQLPPGADYPFHQVVEGDAWVDDVRLPEYNRFVHVDPRDPPPWFAKQKMRHNDFAYRWLVEIRHNSDPPIPGAGSAIFFHIRRGVTRPTSGCTTMAQEDLVTLIRWLRPDKKPHYVLLPRAEYALRWRDWNLPEPQALGALWAAQ